MELKSINSKPKESFSSYDFIKNISASIYWDTTVIGGSTNTLIMWNVKLTQFVVYIRIEKVMKKNQVKMGRESLKNIL